MHRPRLVFFGNERLATGVTTTAPTLQALVEADYEVMAVVSNFTAGTSRNARELEIEKVAKDHDIPVLLPHKPADILDQLQSFKAELGVLVAYGRIIPQEIIDVFPRGIVNIHPSLLPQYRGPTPIETAILDGLEETGVSLMALAAKMDAGPVFAQQKLAISGQSDKQTLADNLGGLGSQMLIDSLPAILDGSAVPTPQKDSAASYTKLLSKEDGQLGWGEPAELIERTVRAFAGWPKARAIIFGKDVVLAKTRIAKDETDGALVMKANPGYLEILELVAPSGRTMSGAEFIRGYKK
jgi:methionyl-tRNA formyltransferase